MPDEHDNSPEITKLVADIQTAMSAYEEFQTQLAAAVKPWQEQWAALDELASPLVAAIQPLQEEITKAAVEWYAVQESWREHSTAIVDAAARWAEAWAEAGEAIAKELAAIGPRLRETLKSAAHVGRLGWTVTMRMMPSDMVRLSQMQPAEADAYMVEWYGEVDPEVNGIETVFSG
jgi:hypothetical protein